jgi:hypothetical protein
MTGAESVDVVVVPVGLPRPSVEASSSFSGSGSGAVFDMVDPHLVVVSQARPSSAGSGEISRMSSEPDLP